MACKTCPFSLQKVLNQRLKYTVSEYERVSFAKQLVSKCLSVLIKTKNITITIMEIEGKIIAVMPAREGTSQRGTQWKSQDYVIETMEQYPKKCCFNVFGSDKIQLFNIQTGENLRVSFDIDAHEYQGRWFNSIRAWKVERVDTNAPAQADSVAPAQAAQQFPPAPEAPQTPASTAAQGADSQSSEDDLPF